MRENALFQIEPDALDRVQLGRVWRQRHERHVAGHNEVARSVPTRLIQDHDRVLVAANRGREAIEELLHGVRVCIRHDQGEAIIGAGFGAREVIGECKAFTGKAWRALAARPQDVARPALLSDARFVLKDQPDTLISMRMMNSSQQRRGSFLKTA